MFLLLVGLLGLLCGGGAVAEKFRVFGTVKCGMDLEQDTFTIGKVHLREHNTLLPDVYLGETALKRNAFVLDFDHTDSWSLEPYVTVQHDCELETRKDRNRPRPSGCYALATHHFDAPPAGQQQVHVVVDLDRETADRRICESSGQLLLSAEIGKN